MFFSIPIWKYVVCTHTAHTEVNIIGNSSDAVYVCTLTMDMVDGWNEEEKNGPKKEKTSANEMLWVICVIVWNPSHHNIVSSLHKWINFHLNEWWTVHNMFALPMTTWIIWNRNRNTVLSIEPSLFAFAFINSNKILITNMIYSIYTPASILIWPFLWRNSCGATSSSIH